MDNIEVPMFPNVPKPVTHHNHPVIRRIMDVYFVQDFSSTKSVLMPATIKVVKAWDNSFYAETNCVELSGKQKKVFLDPSDSSFVYEKDESWFNRGDGSPCVGYYSDESGK